MPSRRPDREHDEYRDLLGAYALWALPRAERAAVEAHLRVCAACRLELVGLELARDALPLGLEAPRLPASLRDRLRLALDRELAIPAGWAVGPRPAGGYDAMVVGARCAGSPTAMLLARRGYRVLLLDKARFPSDTISTHLIQAAGVARLARWGLLERVAASGCPPIPRMAMHMAGVSLSGTVPARDGVAADYAPRRTVLDEILVDAAVAAGAELRQGFTVTELVWEDGRVAGVRGHARGGETVTEHASIVVGADGRHSLVARRVKAEVYDARSAHTCCYYSYWDGVPAEAVELYAQGERAVMAFPTNEGRTCILVDWPRREFRQFRGDVEGNYRRTLAIDPGLAERVAGGRRVEPVRGTPDLPNFYRKPSGPGWALVGDAGYTKDPVTAQGISDAFRDADLLAAALDAALDGREGAEAALARHARQRDEASRPMYELTNQIATLNPEPGRITELVHALRGNQAETDRFFGVLAGTVPVSEFLSPENLRRILAAA